MRATTFEFRFRVVIICTLYFLGFFAPWARFGGNPDPPRLWSWLAIEAARTSFLSVGAAYLIVTTTIVILALAGAWLRVWGTAYLGSMVMRNSAMQAGAVMAAGPYRYLRNPLYVGILMTSAAIAMLMPASGALFFLIAMLVFTLRLVGGEEAFLTDQLGEQYLQYRKAVPSVVPRLQPILDASSARPRWLQGFVAECFPVATGVFFAVLAWSYDANLLTRSIIVCFGASLIVQALTGSRNKEASY